MSGEPSLTGVGRVGKQGQFQVKSKKHPEITACAQEWRYRKEQQAQGVIVAQSGCWAWYMEGRKSREDLGAWTGHRGRGQDTVGVDRTRGHGQDTAVISSTYTVHATWQVLF